MNHHLRLISAPSLLTKNKVVPLQCKNAFPKDFFGVSNQKTKKEKEISKNNQHLLLSNKKHKPIKHQCNEIKEEVLEESSSLLKNTNDSLFQEQTQDKHTQPLRVSTTHHHKNNKSFLRENSSSSHTSSSHTKPNTQTIIKSNQKNYRDELDDINNKLNTIIDNQLERHNHNHILYKQLTDNNKTNFNFLHKKQQQESQKIDDTHRVFNYPITNYTNIHNNYDNKIKVFSERKDILLTESPLPKLKKFSNNKKFPIELISKRSQFELLHTVNNTINTDDDDEKDHSHHTNFKRKLTIKRGKSSNTIQYNEDSNNQLTNNGSRLLTNPCVSGRNFNFEFKRKRVHSAGYNKLKLYTNREDVSYPKKPKKILPSLGDNNKVCNDLNNLVTLATEKYSNDPEIKNMFNNLVNNINEMKLAIEKRNNSKDTSPLDHNKNPQSHHHHQSNLSSLKGKKLNKPFKKINLQKLFSQRKKDNKDIKDNMMYKKDI